MDPTAVLIIDPTIGWLGQTWGFWVQTGALFASILAAVGVIYHNGKLAKIIATVELVTSQKSDEELNSALSIIMRHHRERSTLSPFVSKMDTEEGKAIRLVLNNHEFVCLGIRCGAFDERIFKLMQHYNFLRTWEACSGIVHEIRRQEARDTLFQEFEWLAKRWKRCPLKVIK